MIAEKKKEYQILEKLCRNIDLGKQKKPLCNDIQTSTLPVICSLLTTYKEKEDHLLSIYTLTDHHLTDKQISRVHVRKKDKWSWRMLNPIRFNEFSWGGLKKLFQHIVLEVISNVESVPKQKHWDA